MRTERSFTYFIIFDFFSKQCSGTDPLPTSQACTPLAHEAISLPTETGIHPDGTVSLRSPLALASENPGGGALPAWVGTEMKSARHLAETGEQTVRLIKPNAPPRAVPALITPPAPSSRPRHNGGQWESSGLSRRKPSGCSRILTARMICSWPPGFPTATSCGSRIRGDNREHPGSVPRQPAGGQRQLP